MDFNEINIKVSMVTLKQLYKTKLFTEQNINNNTF